MSRAQPFAIVNARMVDPDSGYDGPGSVVVTEGVLADVRRSPDLGALSSDIRVIEADGALLAPGLIDIRVKTGEPGAEPRETLKSASRAAAAGGVTTLVLMPDTDPPLDDPAMIDFVQRRARDLDMVRVRVAGAATQKLGGERMAEIGLMAEAGAVYFTDADHIIRDSRVLRQVMSYASGFNALVSHRPVDPWLSAGTCATEGEMAAWLGLPAAPALAERIMLERDLALVELTGVRFLVDQLTTAEGLDSLDRARGRGLEVSASVSINHLRFNEVDVGDFRTFYRLDPPLRSESDRQAMVEALRDGKIDVLTSAHTPAPAEDKRLPFSEAAPGAVGLETLLAAALSLHHEDGVSLLEVLRPLTLGPAQLLGLEGGRLAAGAPADLVLCDAGAPVLVDADRLISKSKNSPFDGRRLQGQVLMTVVEGRVVHRIED